MCQTDQVSKKCACKLSLQIVWIVELCHSEMFMHSFVLNSKSKPNQSGTNLSLLAESEWLAVSPVKVAE